MSIANVSTSPIAAMIHQQRAPANPTGGNRANSAGGAGPAQYAGASQRTHQLHRHSGGKAAAVTGGAASSTAVSGGGKVVNTVA